MIIIHNKISYILFFFNINHTTDNEELYFLTLKNANNIKSSYFSYFKKEKYNHEFIIK
jgi:hypothetical protein